MLHQVMDKPKHGIPLMRKAIAIIKEAKGDWSPEYALTIRHLGVLWRDAGDSEAAAPLLEKSLAIMRKAGGDKHPDCDLIRDDIKSLKKPKGTP